MYLYVNTDCGGGCMYHFFVINLYQLIPNGGHV